MSVKAKDSDKRSLDISCIVKFSDASEKIFRTGTRYFNKLLE